MSEPTEVHVDGAARDRRRGDQRSGRWHIDEAQFDDGSGRLTVAGQVHDLDHSSHELLHYLLENAGKVASKDQLLKAGWPGRLATESSLTKAIHRLRQALNDPEGNLLCTVHGYGYRLTARAVPLAEPASTGAGTGAVDAAHLDAVSAASVVAVPSNRRGTGRAALLGGALLVVIITLFSIASQRQDANADTHAGAITATPAVVVLPFKDLSSTKNYDYLADGITEDLLNGLARIPRLRVIGQTTAFSFKGQAVDILAIGKSLRVTHVLEGSVRVSGDRLRVTAQLVRTADAVQVWSHSYDTNLGDVFALQEVIASAVATKLRVHLLGKPRPKHRPDPRAYALVQRSRQLQRLGLDEIDSYGPLIRQAVAIDPEYADAWYILGILFIDEIDKGRRPGAEGLRLARAAYNKSLSLDPDNAVVYALLGSLTYFKEGDPAGAAPYYERALSMEPANLKVLFMGAALANALGRREEAIRAIEYVVDRDPVDAFTQRTLGFFYYRARRWDDAIACFRTALAISPNTRYANAGIGDSLLQNRQFAAALSSYEQENDERHRLYGRTVVNHLLGRMAESDAALDTLLTKFGSSPDDGDNYWIIATALAQRGDADRAFHWLDRISNPNYYDFESAIELSKLHGDSRWLPFLRKVGKAPEQLSKLQRIEFNFEVPVE